MYDVYQPSQNEHHQLLSQDSTYADPTAFIASQISSNTSINPTNKINHSHFWLQIQTINNKDKKKLLQIYIHTSVHTIEIMDMFNGEQNGKQIERLIGKNHRPSLKRVRECVM